MCTIICFADMRLVIQGVDTHTFQSLNTRQYPRGHSNKTIAPVLSQHSTRHQICKYDPLGSHVYFKIFAIMMTISIHINIVVNIIM